MRVFVGEPGYEYKENFRTLSLLSMLGHWIGGKVLQFAHCQVEMKDSKKYGGKMGREVHNYMEF